MKVAGVARDVAVMEGKGLRFGKVIHVPFAYIAWVVVAPQGVDPAAVVGMAGVARPIDGVLDEKQFLVLDLLSGGYFCMADQAVFRFVVMGIECGIDGTECGTINPRHNLDKNKSNR